MSTYVMSDIHGNYTKFLKMLRLIKFSEEDRLYILGDIIDRGSQPFHILSFILKHNNIMLLKGNHEEMLIDFFETNTGEQLWFYNGGYKTYEQFSGKEYREQKAISDYFKSRPDFVVLKDKFILSHAGIYIPENGDKYTIDELVENLGDNFLWNRTLIDNERPYQHYIQICGHTPVQVIDKNADKIINRDSVIYIDCGATFTGGKLAALRLDDMEEFYV